LTTPKRQRLLKTCRFIYQVISPWERGDLRRKRLGKEIGLELRMDNIPRDRLTAGSALEPEDRGQLRDETDKGPEGNEEVCSTTGAVCPKERLVTLRRD